MGRLAFFYKEGEMRKWIIVISIVVVGLILWFYELLGFLELG